MKAGERADEEPAEAGRSLVPMYLKNIANTTKEQLFKSLFGQQKKAAEAEDEEATSAPKTATEESATGAEKSETEENTDTQSNEENAEDEEIHHIDCLLQVKCLEVKRRIWPVVDDAFFKKNCQMTRNELFDAAEEAAEELAKSAASKYALGAAAQALDEITQVEVAESLFEAQAKATWQQQVKAREFQGEKDKRTESKEEFAKWKEENRRGIENILRTAFAIQAVFQQERLQVDEAKLHKDLAKAMLQVSKRGITTGEAPEMVLKQLYKKAQASVVYDFIVKHANVEYYIDDTPAQVTVQPEGTGIPQQGIRAFPRGVDVKEWHQMRKETIEQRDKLKEQAQRFFVDPKTLKKFNQDDSNKL
ncbi:uncharacterized protein EMH_0059060 [Eimeria mitis]|uniref:Trigger factor C-terminal domain-containing protein n=1 Tax=Eimeria mitis TaxID=44415 RepID=U6K446_9EIME|nr:uncharacterized protein EMH_0059060 [Eimeria mitis]CDJ30528.1 hypothetical protein, conserved [Eimeria mitis]